MKILTSNNELDFWMKSCGCPKPALYWDNEFDARICGNCGVIVTQENEEIPPFVHLRVHTHLSFLKATCKIEDVLPLAKQYDMPAIAKTEFSNLCGAPSFVKKCDDAGIKPILGTEFKVIFPATPASITFNVTFIALNNAGYRALVALNTKAWCERQNKQDGIHILFDDVPVAGSNIHNDSLIALVDSSSTSSLNLDFVLPFIKGRLETYIDIHKCDQDTVNTVSGISQKHDIPVVVTGNVLYTKKEDAKAYEIGLKVGNHKGIYVDQLIIDNYFKSKEEMFNILSFDDEWLINSSKIADRVEDYKIINKDPIIPTFKDKNGEWTIEQSAAKLEMECWTRLYEKGLADNPVYVERLQHELGMMKEKRFSSYFLIINEIIEYMKETGKLKPIGRGSSVGSLVCYLLDIISIDPIVRDVPFDRFINYGRVDLPDIDTDITQEGRKDVLSHIANVHGHERVAQIATYQTLKLRAAIENVGRAMQVPHSLNRDIRKKISEDIEDLEDLDAEVKQDMYQYNENWLDIAESLLGTAKNFGYHAAGIVISNEDLSEMVPLIPSNEDDGLLGIQYDMHDCEVLGLLKLDMLGLKTLDIIQHTLDRIGEGGYAIPDIYNLPADDIDTYQYISNGDYVSLFQLDSTGYRRLCKQLKPAKFEHIMALNALFRPGPLNGGMTDEYVERRHGRQELIGWHPLLDNVLEPTYQVPVYQEQVMAIAKIIAGFDDVEADKYRKAIGKKNKVIFDEAQEKFKERSLSKEGLVVPPGYDGTLEQWINELLEKLSGYARYGWNSLTGDTIIQLADGSRKTIKDLVGDLPTVISTEDGKLINCETNRVWKTNTNKVYKITTKHGNQIRATKGHKFLTPIGWRSIDIGLKIDDYLAIPKILNIDSDNTIDDYKIITVAHLITESDTCKANHVVFYNSDKNLIDDFSINAKKSANTELNFRIKPTIFTEVTEVRTKRINRSEPQGLYDFAKELDLTWKRSGEKRIPNQILKLNNRCIALFLGRLWDGDGGVITSTNGSEIYYTSKSYLLLEDIRSCLLRFGIRSRIKYVKTRRDKYYIDDNGDTKEYVNRDKEIYKLIVSSSYYYKSFIDNIVPNMLSVNKVARFNEIKNKILNGSVGKIDPEHLLYVNINKYYDIDMSSSEDITYDKIVSIEEDSIEDVYDLSVNGPENFIANNVCTHNSGHSAGYGWITYITAYLESHFPLQYYTSLLDANEKNTKKLSTLIKSILKAGVKIVPPNVNESGIKYAIGSDNNIYMGLSAIRSVGKAAAEIVIERSTNGRFLSFIDFCQRLPSVNKKAKVNLIKAGAFSWDSMVCDRDKVTNVDVINKIVRKRNKKFDGSKVSPFQVAMECHIDGNDYSELEKQENEREVLNSFITGHPASIYHRLSPHLFISDSRVVCPHEFRPLRDDSDIGVAVGETILLVGMIDNISHKTTKPKINKAGIDTGSKPYLTINISDDQGFVIIRIWHPMSDIMSKTLVPGQIAMFEGIARQDNFNPDWLSLSVKGGVMLSSGLPIQGIFCDKDQDVDAVMNKVGGVRNNTVFVNNQQFTSIRGRIHVKPHLLEDVVDEFNDVKFLLALGSGDA